MSATILINELSSLIADAKRKRSDLKKAAESSLESLESRKHLSRESLTKYLLQKQSFASPFFIACASKESKLLRAGITGLEQLIALHAISEDLLPRLVETLQSLTSSGQEIQLKLVQCLQKLEESYSEVLRGNLLAKILNLCITIESKGEGGAPRAATAAFQQHIGSLFEAVNSDAKFQGDGESTVSALTDSEKVLRDLCSSIQDRQTQFLEFPESRNRLNLELLDALLPIYSETFMQYKGLADSMRGLLLPYLIQNLNEYQDFHLACIVSRLISHLLREHLDQYLDYAPKIIDSLDDQILLTDTPFWKRALCLEVFVRLHGAPGVMRRLDSYLEYGETKVLSGLQQHVDTLQVVIDNPPEVFGAFNQSPTHSRKSPSSKSTSGKIGPPQSESSPGSHIFTTDLTASSRNPPCLAQNDRKIPSDLPALYLHRLAISSLIQLSNEMKSCISTIAFARSNGLYENGTKSSDEIKIEPSQLMSLPQSSADVKSCASFMRKYGEDLLSLHCRFLFAPFDLALQEDFVLSLGDLFFVAKICGLKRGALQILRNLCSLVSSSQVDDNLVRAISKEDQRLVKASIEARSLSCLDALSSLSEYLGSILDVTEWSQIWSTFSEAEMVGGISAHANESTQLVRQKYLSRLLRGTKHSTAETLNKVMSGISQRIRESYTAPGANQFLNQRVSFMVRGLAQFLKANVDSFLGPRRSIPDMEIPIAILCDCAIDEDLNPETHAQAADALDGWLLLLVSSSKSISTESQAHLYQTAFEGIHRQVFGSQDSKDRSTAMPVLSAESVQIKALSTLKSLVELCGDKIRSEWAYIYETLLSVFPRTSTIFPDDLLDLPWDSSNGEHSEPITRSSELVRPAFEVFQLIVADFVPEALSGRDIFPFTQMLHDFSMQRLDMNISLQSISAYYQCGLDIGVALNKISAQETPKSLNNPDNKKTQLQWRRRREPNDDQQDQAASIDALGSLPEYRWTSLTNSLICVTQDPRSEVRNAALKMTIKLISLRKEYMDAYSFPVINKLLFVNRDAHENIRDAKNVRQTQSSSSLVKEWNESSTIVLEQISSLISPPPISSKDVGPHRKGLGLIISQVAAFSEYSSPQLCMAICNALARVVEQNDSLISHDENLLSQVWKTWLLSKPAVDTQSPRLSHDVLLSWASFLHQTRLVHGSRFTLSQVNASLRAVTPWILYDSLPEYTSDKDSMTEFQEQVLQILKTLISDDPDFLLRILYYCVVFSSLAYLTGQSGISTKQTLVAFSKEALDIEKSLLLDYVGASAFYKQPDVIFSALAAISAQIRGKDEQHTTNLKERSVSQHASDNVFEVLRKVLPLLPNLSVSNSAKRLVVSGALTVDRCMMYGGEIQKDSSAIDAEIGDVVSDAEADDIQKVCANHRLLRTVISSSDIYQGHALRYAQDLFQESKQQNLAPMEDFSTKQAEDILDLHCRRGRTYDPQLQRRVKMARECLLLLTDLATGNEPAEGKCLYWGARKLFLYRVFEPVESYIMDQPLRGLLPLPRAYREELIMALDLLRDTHQQNNTQSKAGTQWRKDVSKLAPFIAQAIKIAQRDAELLEIFAQVSFITGSSSSPSNSGIDDDDATDTIEDKEIIDASEDSKQESLQAPFIYEESELSSAWTDAQQRVLKQLPGLFKSPKELDSAFLATMSSHQARKEAYESARARNPGPKWFTAL